MAEITKGILGGFSGTVGTVIGGTWKGIDYMRSLPRKSKKAPTADQLVQQAKFAATTKFLQLMAPFLEITFKSFAIRMTGYNAAFSYNVKNAIIGKAPTFTIDYANALVSRGKLQNGGAPAAAVSGGTNISFTWTDNSGTAGADATDKTMLMVYCPAKDLCIYTNGNTTRDAGTEALDVKTFTGQVVEVWIAFAAKDNEDASNSIFLGELTIS